MKKIDRILGISMGDPSGVGPEIILKSFLELRNEIPVVIIGDFSVLNICKEKLFNKEDIILNKITAIDEFIFDSKTLNIYDLNIIDIQKFEIGKVSKESGHASFKYIEKAIKMAINKEISGVVTAPINKEAINLAGHKFSGHTEIFAHYTQIKDYAMLLYDDKLKVSHVSTHVALLDCILNLKKDRILKVLELSENFLRQINIKSPKIAVSGINPHASENGMFGKEENDIIIPSINEYSLKSSAEIIGPEPPDTVFLKASEGKYDLVIAMYHDQGHIPMKMLGFDSGVNITLGLPIIRTSVDHGTAFDISWKKIASNNSLNEAIKIGYKLSLFK